LGHRRMAFISGPLRVDNSNARRQAFLDGMRQIGVRVPASYLPEGDHTMESGFKGAERLLSLPDRPTAILCSTDMTASGALHAASDRQLRVPEDVSIVGFDDIHMAQFTVPPLTTVRISSERIASTALDILIGSIEHRKAVEQPVIPTQLVVRATTGYAPAPKDGRKSRPRSGR
ncbi:MAG TPA: substrate-binding domain-containing protein, partial [Acidobacteriaceae bacterium]